MEPLLYYIPIFGSKFWLKIHTWTTITISYNYQFVEDPTLEEFNYDDDTDSDFEPIKKKTKRVQVISDEVCATADRYNISDSVLCSVLARSQEAQDNKNNVTLSRSTIKRRREEFRKIDSALIKEGFIPASLLTIHWDGKLFEKKGTSKKEHRLAIVVTGTNQEKVLSVPATDSGKGEDEAEAVVQALKEWNLEDKVKSMCFDTTNSNTGRHIGACKILESKLGIRLVSFACRHHMFELIPSAIYKQLFERNKTEGPNISLFDKFRREWPSISASADQWKSGLVDEKISTFLLEIKADVVSFINQQLTSFQPRGVYKKLLQLMLHFFGEGEQKVHT